MINIFEKLATSYVIAVGDQLLKWAGGYPIGAVASVLPDKETGLKFIDDYRADLKSEGLEDPHLLSVGDPFRLMRRAAGEGLAGIEGARIDIFPERFMFMVRVEEAGANLPTILTSITEEGWGPSLTRAGEADISHASLLHWQRFDILDQVTGVWGQQCPFRDWDHGDQFYELRTDKLVVLLANVPLLEDWNSTEGAFAFFTEEANAHHYLEHHLGDGRNRMLSVGPFDHNDARQMMASLRSEPVHDLRDRLAELQQIKPFAAWCINPDSSRENGGYGRLIYVNHPAAVGETASGPLPRMIAVSGHWSVQPRNIFKLEQPFAPWTGKDTVRWSGGQALQLVPLDRSFATGAVPDDIDYEDLTDSDAEVIVAQKLHSENDMEAAWKRLASWCEDMDGHLHQFHLITWDAVTGDGADSPWRFPNVFEVLSFLATYERLHDRSHRSVGAVSCTHIGFAGSNDEDFESLRSQRFQLGLSRIGLRILQHGYIPKDADDLVALCNGMLRTLHVDVAGYPKDLIWASSSEQGDTMCEKLSIEEATYYHWAKSADVAIDPEGKKLVLERIGVGPWESLLPKTQHFLATALQHLKQQGHAPQLDYAGISLEVVKALEVELIRVFEGYREHMGPNFPAYDKEVHAQQSLVDYLNGGKAPTIGTISYLLRKPTVDDSELARSLYEYVMSLDNGEFLTSSKFAKKGLNRVIHKYRNSGVHDSPISWETCMECVEKVIGTLQKPGYLTLISSTK